MRSAAMAMDCRPEEQKRLMVTPVTHVGQAGAQGDVAGHVLAGLAFRHGAAEDHVFDFVSRDLRILLQQRAEHRGGEIVRADVPQSALGGFADRRAEAIDDYCFLHVRILVVESLSCGAAFRSSACAAMRCCVSRRAAEAQERFALEIEQILFGDQCSPVSGRRSVRRPVSRR